MKITALLLFFCFSFTAFAAGPSAVKIKPAPQPGFCIFGAQSGKPFGTVAAFKSVIWKSDVVYAGGDAGLLTVQEARLEALKAMREARGSKIAVGFEAFDMNLQPALDDFTAGKISEEDLLQKAARQKGSAVDPAVYKPVLNFIARNKLRALALNVPKEIISKIEREGPASLNDEDKKLVPSPLKISKHKKYLEFLKTSFGGGVPVPAEAPAWDNYLASVSAWNEAAGTRIADFINSNPGWSLLIMAGNNRLAYNAALPASVKSRTIKLRQASFYAEDGTKCPAALPKERKDLANYIWYTSSTTITTK